MISMKYFLFFGFNWWGYLRPTYMWNNKGKCYKPLFLGIWIRFPKNDKSKSKIVVFKNGDYKIIESGITWEYENDNDWLVTIDLKSCK